MAKTVDPFTEILKLHSRLNKKFERAFKKYKRPHSHISQGAEKIEIEIKLPGMKKKDVDLEINPRSIAIRAEKKSKKSKATLTSSSTKTTYNNYFRKIVLPTGLEVKKAKASFNNNTLKIKIPKKN